MYKKLISIFIPILFLLTQPFSVLSKVLFQKDSLYHYIIVIDEGDSRYLNFNQMRQSGMFLNDPYKLRLPYTDYFHTTLLFKEEFKDVLLIGLGGGSIPKKFYKDYPSMRIDVAEIDPMVVEVAKRFFYVKEDNRMKIFIQDGRLFVKKTKNKYDLVILDAYYADAIPFHLTTKEFLLELKDKMKPDGVVASNIIGAISGSRSKLFRSMLKTFNMVFPQTYIFPVNTEPDSPDDESKNIILVATMDSKRISWMDIMKRANKSQSENRIKANVREFARSLIKRNINTDNVPALTDDYAPVDSLLHF